MGRPSRADVYMRLLATADDLEAMAGDHGATTGATALRAAATLLRVLARAYFQAL
jgi:hypothetical protein